MNTIPDIVQYRLYFWFLNMSSFLLQPIQMHFAFRLVDLISVALILFLFCFHCLIFASTYKYL